MNALIETLNRWGELAVPVAGQILWQSSLLIIVLLALDLLLRRRVRAGFRYALWMLLLVKLVLPPTLALPTGAGYWIERPPKSETPDELAASNIPEPSPLVIGDTTANSGTLIDAEAFDLAVAEAMADRSSEAAPAPPADMPAPSAELTLRGQLLAAWLTGTLLLLGWMLWRWRWVSQLVRRSEPAPADLQTLATNVCRAACPTSNVSPAACRQSGLSHAHGQPDAERKGDTLVASTGDRATEMSPFRFRGRQPVCPAVRLTDTAMSPAVCGLFRPVILLPRKLVNRLTDDQLRTVLLHELIHLRRRDLWVNCLQTLLQIAAWWHPLLWVANARIRRVREEAVDEAVACALRDDAEAYPATLLEVAKLTFTRPLLTLGLVGILESKNALKQRIRRLLELPPLESTRLKWWQWTVVVAVALTALPMAQGQRQAIVQPIDETPAPSSFSARAGISYDPRTDLAPWENPNPTVTIVGYEYQPSNKSWPVEATRLFQTRQYAQAVQKTPPPITTDVWAVKLDRKAWAWLTRHPDTRRVTGQTNAYVFRGGSLGEWLDSQEGVEKLKGGQFSGQEHRSLVVGDYSPDRRTIEPYSQARIELTSWLDEADPKQIWLKLDGVIDWSGEMSKSRNLYMPPAGGNSSSTPVMVNAFERARGYVNQQFKTDGTLVGLGDWLIIGEPFDRQTIEPIFAVVVQPFLAQSASIDPGGQPTGPGRPPSSDQGSASPQSQAGNPIAEGQNKNAVNPDTEPPQVEIKVRVVELHQVEDHRALGSDWLIPALWGAVQKLGTVKSDILALTLTDPQFRVVIKALEQRAGVHLEFMPRVITPSGRQVEYKLPEHADLASRDDNLPPTGTSRLLHVIPHVAADGSTIQMRLIYMTGELPDMTEPATREPLSATNPVPLYGVRRIVNQSLTNGQTIVLPFQPLSSSLKLGTNAMRTLIFITPTIVEPQSPSPDPTQNGVQVPSRRITPEDLAASYFPWKSKATQGQPLPSGLAVTSHAAEAKTGVAREERRVELRRKLADARQREADGSLIQAAQLLDEAYRSAKALAPGTEVELAAAVDAIIALRSKLAEAYRDLGDLSGANEHLVGGLKVAPTNPRLLELKRTNDADLVREGGSESAVKIQNAKLLIEWGRLDEAEALLREAARIDSGSTETSYLLDRIQQLRSERSQPAPGSTSSPSGRDAMMEKLNKITLDQLHFEGLPLVEVIKELSDEVRRSDPYKTGVSFMLLPRLESPDGAEGSAATNDIANAVIDITPPLRGLRLIDALHAIVTASDRRIKFTVEEFAVVFTQGTSEPVKLETRQFQVNPNTFYDGLKRYDAANLGMNQAVKRYFDSVGVELVPPKTLFFNDRKGLLLVRATNEDMAMVERAIELLNPDPPQITLELHVAEIDLKDRESLGFSWLADVSSRNSPSQETTVSHRPVEVLSETQFRVVIKALEERAAGVRQLTRVTTLSGHRTELVLREKPLMLAPQFGPVFDKLEVIPYALSEGGTIQATVISTVRSRLDDEDKQAPVYFRLSQGASSAILKPGSTMAFAVPTGLSDSVASGTNVSTIVFITPTIVDSPGNAVRETGHSPGRQEIKPPPPTEP